MDHLLTLERYLGVNHPSRELVRGRLIKLLRTDSPIPAFPEPVIQLCNLAQNDDATLSDFAEVIRMDPALVARCLRVASSVGFAAHSIQNIQQALALLGVKEIRRIAFSVATIDTFSHLKTKINWKRFWLHNVLVARLSEKLASALRKTNGMEYLAGLLHDIGKLMIEHYFPQEFDLVVLRATSRKCNHATVERELLGLDHTQIGAAICDCLQVHTHVLKAVQFHHDPLNRDHVTDGAGDRGFLASCVSLADRLAHAASSYTGGQRRIEDHIEESAEWLFLNQLATPRKINFDLETEIARAREEIEILV
jgi:putative nucleotidyltransferase with HDIG domain